MKKTVTLMLSAMLLTLTAACQLQTLPAKTGAGNEPVLSIEVEQLITEYIEEQVAHQAHDGRTFAAQEIYGTEEKEDGKIHVYLWAYYMEYYLRNGTLHEGGGASLPLVLVLDKNAAGLFFVAEHHTPLDGSGYAPSVRRLFPQKYHKRIFSRTNVHDLEPLVRQKGERHFQQSAGLYSEY
ncbi:MAG: hypothetical protein AB1796_04430 [Bacillota bacterium]